MYQLNNDFISGNPKIESLRKSFGRELVEIAKTDERIVALSADLSSSVGFGGFAKEMGDRYIEVGVAEQPLWVKFRSPPAMPSLIRGATGNKSVQQSV